MQLVAMKEADGEIEDAAKLLGEVNVETCGAMEQKEKAHFLIEQMRLYLLSSDFVRTRIVSRKVINFFTLYNMTEYFTNLM